MNVIFSEGKRQNEIKQKQEIERKFLVDELPKDLDRYEQVEIDQSYLEQTDPNVEERVRRRGDKFFFTRKTGHGSIRDEDEHEISAQEYQQLLNRTKGSMVSKTRYIIPLDGGDLELDIYSGDLAGKIVAEIELDSADAVVDLPPWLSREVTGDSRFSNHSLALHGWPESEKSIPEYEKKEGIAKLINLVREKLAASQGPMIVEIAGGSASGKTSQVAAKVREAFGSDAQILSMDNYYHGAAFMDEQARLGSELNWDQPEALNIEQLRKDLIRLKDGQAVQIPEYNFSTGTSTPEAIEVKPSRVIIVEGLFALNDQITGEADIHAFVDIGMHGRIMRRLMRDVVERPGQSPRDIIKYFADVVEPMHQKYVQSSKVNADLVIKNEYSPKVEASRSGMHEAQLKFRTSLDPEKLRILGAELLGKSHQVDRYFNPSDRDLAKTDELLRIRTESGQRILTYKGPKSSNPNFRERPKFEFAIDEPTERSFVNIYGDSFSTVEKDRTLYQLDGMIFSLDNVVFIEDGAERSLGEFVEIRGSRDGDESRISQLMQELELDLSSATKESYLEIGIGSSA